MDKRNARNSQNGQDARRPKRSRAEQQTDSGTGERLFTPDVLDKTVIAVPLLDILAKEEQEARQKKTRSDQPQRHPLIIDLNLEFPGGRKRAGDEVKKLIRQAIATVNTQPRIGKTNGAP